MQINAKRRVIAFYLPQFHPIAENDKYWGTGFTEWTNVGRAKTLFKGHNQPRIPADLGYYDLRLPEIREAQASMAKNAGIEGFMYWHYWFGNKKTILEMPFQEVLKSGKPDFPFSLGWANQPWFNKTWQDSKIGNKDSVIIEQLYPGEEDYISHFNYVLPAFKDERYIKVDGKPLFLIYAPLDMPDVSSFLKLWRRLALENGLKGIHFVARSYGWVSNNSKILNLGFDAINSNGQWEAECKVKGKYHQLIHSKIVEKFGGIKLLKYNYASIIKNFFNEEDTLDNVYPTIIPQWDRSPRSGKSAVIYYNSTPELFEEHIKNAFDLVKDKDPEHQIIFLKSWNEWGEGNYVEPDLKYGYSFLNVLKKFLK